MLYFLVAFIALTTIKQWNPLFTPHAAFLRPDDSHPSAYPLHGHHNTATCATYDSVPNLDLTLDVNSMGSNWHFYFIPAGLKTHTTGDTAVGHVTQYFMRCPSDAITA